MLRGLDETLLSRGRARCISPRIAVIAESCQDYFYLGGMQPLFYHVQLLTKRGILSDPPMICVWSSPPAFGAPSDDAASSGLLVRSIGNQIACLRHDQAFLYWWLQLPAHIALFSIFSVSSPCCWYGFLDGPL
jgi:hypothetical protein